MNTTHKFAFTSRTAWLAAIAILAIVTTMFYRAPLAQAVAARIQASPMAARLLSYAPAPVRARFGPEKAHHSATGSSLLSTFTKTASPAPGNVQAGGLITYTVTLTNENDGFDDFDVLLADATAVPANTTFVSASISQQPAMNPLWTCAAPAFGVAGPAPITCQPNEVIKIFVAGQTFQYQYTVRVNPTTAPGTMITSGVVNYQSSTGNAGAPQNVDSNNIVHTVINDAILTINKTGPATVCAGDTFTYQITVNNSGTSTALGVTIQDPLPANTTFLNLSGTGALANGCAHNGGTPGIVACTGINVPAGSHQLNITVRLSPSAPVGILPNIATITAVATGAGAGATSTFNTTVSHCSDLEITKADSPDAVLAGQDINYTLTVKNIGPSDLGAGQFVVNDTTFPPTGTALKAGTTVLAPGFSCNGTASAATCTSTTATLPVGASATIKFTVTVNANFNGGLPGAFITNTATTAVVGANITEANLTNNSSTVNTPVGPSADLSVTKSALTAAGGIFGAAVTAGGGVTGGFGIGLVGSGEIEYTLTYRNSGLGDATNVHIRDVIPAGTLLVPTFLPIAVLVTPVGAPGLTCQILPTLNEYQLDCTPNTAGGVLPAGANGTIQFSVRVPENILDGAVIKNVATIHSEGAGASPATPDPNGGNNTSNETQNIVRTSADLSITKTGPATAVAGTNITYTLTVTNNGVSDAQNVLVKDTLPPNVSFVSLGAGSDPRFACLPDNGNAGIVNCTAATLIAPAINAPPIIPPRIGSNIATIIIVGKVAANVANGTPLINNASVSAATQDPVIINSNNAAPFTTTVATEAAVTIVKTDTPDPVVAGTNLLYTITVANAGPSNAVLANVVDTLPAAGVTFVAATGTGIFSAANACTNAGLTVTCVPAGGIIPAGSSSNIRILVKVDPAFPANPFPHTPDIAGLTNTATVNWSDSNGGAVLVAQSTNDVELTTVIHNSDMTIQKEAPDTVVAGSRMDYRLIVSNNGPSTVLGDATLGSIMVMDLLPLGTSLAAVPNNPFVSPGGPGGFTCTYVAATRKVSCLNAAGAAGNFPSGATVEIIIKVDTASNLTEGQNLINCAQVTLRNTNPTPEVDPLGGGQHDDANAVTLAASGNNEACDSTVVRTLADLAIAKSALPVVDPDGAGPLAPVALPIVGPNVPPGSVNAGGYIRYDIPFGNNGPSDAINTIITDQIAGNTAFVGALATGGVFVPAAQPPVLPFVFTIQAVDTVAPLGGPINLTCTVFQNPGSQSIYCRPQGNPAVANPTPPPATVAYADGTLPAGYNGTLTFFVMVNESVAAGTIVANPANITSGLCPNTVGATFPPIACLGTADPNTANNTTLATQTLVINSSNLTISKIVQSAVTSASNPNQTGPIGPATAPNGAALTGTAVLPGTYLTYRVTITNNGPSDVSNLRLTDLLPSGLETPPGRVLGAKYISVTPVGVPSGVTFTCAAPTGINPSNNPQGNGGSLACTAPLLSANAPNNTAAVDIVVFIDPATKANLVNAATIDATLNNFNRPVSGTTTLTTPVAATSDLALTKTHVNAAGVLNGPVIAGTDFEYQVTITNNGPSAAQMVSLVDTIPAFQALKQRNQLGTLVSDIVIETTPDGNGNSNFTCVPLASAFVDPRAVTSTITCTAAELPPNKKPDGTVNPAGTVLFRIRMRQSSLTPQPVPTVYNNCVTATSMSTDPIPANNTNVCHPVDIIFRADLAGVKIDTPDPVIAGTNLTYTITASNNGASAALNFMISDQLPAGTVFLSAVASPGATLTTPAVNANGIVKATWNALGGTPGGLTDVGIVRTLMIIVRVCPDFQQNFLAAGLQMCQPNLTNTAVISSDTPATTANLNPLNATAVTTVQAQADLSIVKTAPASAPFSTTMGNSIVTYTLNFANAGPSNAAGVVVTDVLPKGFVVDGTPTSTVAGTTFVITTTAGVTTVTGNVGVLGAVNQCSATPAPVSGTITIRAIVPIKHPIATVTNTSTISTTNCLPDPNLANNTSSAMTAITEPGVIGQSFPAASQVSDQKAGSILFYPFYTSDAANPNSQNTRISLTNVSSKEQVTVHLFAVDGSSCSVLDTFVCLTPNQTASLLVSDFDPGASGYLMALVVDSVTGLPRAFNCLIGDEYFKMATGYQANVGAEAVSALMPFPAGTDTSATQATLAFDGMSYNLLPRQLAISNFPSPNDGNATLFILNRISGNYITTGDAIGGIAGQVFDDSEIGLSFTANLSSCQYRKVLDSTFPRTFNPFPRFISSGRSGWMKFAGAGDIALLGLTVNLHDNPRGATGGFSQGRNMHKLTLTDKARIIVPVYLPSC